MSEQSEIREFVKVNGTITAWQAVHILGINDPRSRIAEMGDVGRHHFDVKINKKGKTSRYAVYAFI